MILVPLEQYGHRPWHDRQTVGIDLADEGAEVVLTVDFEKEEFFHSKSTIVSGDPTGAATDVARTLLPSEARSIAAALVHFANEAERPR